MDNFLSLFLTIFVISILDIYFGIYLGMIHQKGMHLKIDFYVVVGRQCRTQNVHERRVTNTISLYKLTNVLLLFICFKLVLSF